MSLRVKKVQLFINVIISLFAKGKANQGGVFHFRPKPVLTESTVYMGRIFAHVKISALLPYFSNAQNSCLELCSSLQYTIAQQHVENVPVSFICLDLP